MQTMIGLIGSICQLSNYYIGKSHQRPPLANVVFDSWLVCPPPPIKVPAKNYGQELISHWFPLIRPY